jgi:hypothetical protein
MPRSRLYIVDGRTPKCPGNVDGSITTADADAPPGACASSMACATMRPSLPSLTALARGPGASLAPLRLNCPPESTVLELTPPDDSNRRAGPLRAERGGGRLRLRQIAARNDHMVYDLAGGKIASDPKAELASTSAVPGGRDRGFHVAHPSVGFPSGY